MTDALALVDWLRRVAPAHKEGTARGFAFNMDGLCLQELNAKINEAADTLSKLMQERSWRGIESAPRDGTLVLLLVDYLEGDHWIDDSADGLGRTIGHNNDDNVLPGEGEGWQFAGWCWTHDHYVQGQGRPVAWQPLPQGAFEPAPNARTAHA